MEKTDRLIPLVWLAFVPLAVLTAIFGPALVLLPSSTEDYWSWEIRPDMSAVWVGAGYTFGAIAITTMLLARSWRSGIVPIVATWPFSIAMFAATVIHEDRFFTDTTNFYIWLVIYVALPVVLPIIWWLNRGEDPGIQPGDMLAPHGLVHVARALGVLVTLLSLVMLASPSTAADIWPWQLTPLMSRVMGGWVLFLGTALLCLFFERRYIAYRLFLPAAGIWMGILFVASFFHLDDFDFDRLRSWLWFVTVAAVAVSVFLIYFRMERLLHSRPDRAPATESNTAA